MAQRKPNSRAGFTLIELMVVVGLIVVMIGSIGVLRMGGNESVAMTSAQSSLAALFTSAKLQATSSGRDVLIMVDLYPGVISGNDVSQHVPNSGYLRRFIMLKRTSATGDGYVKTGREFYLPEGIYFIPPPTVSAPITATNIGNTRFRWATDGSTRKSSSGGGSLTQYGAATPTGIIPAAAASQFYGWRISPDGRIRQINSTTAMGHLQMSTQIVLGIGRRLYIQGITPPALGVIVTNGYGAKGIRISYYGQVSMVNNLDSFD